jgi:hypothetical protein
MLYSNNQRLRLVFEELDTCYGNTRVHFPRLQRGLGHAPTWFLGVPAGQPLIQVPYLKTRIIPNTVQPDSKKSCSVESYRLAWSRDLEWQSKDLVGVVVYSKKIDLAPRCSHGHKTRDDG